MRRKKQSETKNVKQIDAKKLFGNETENVMRSLAIFCLLKRKIGFFVLLRSKIILSRGDTKNVMQTQQKETKNLYFFGLRARKCFASFRSCFPKLCGSETKKNPFSQNDANTCYSGSEPAVSHIKNVISLRDISPITTHGHRLIIWGVFLRRFTISMFPIGGILFAQTGLPVRRCKARRKIGLDKIEQAIRQFKEHWHLKIRTHLVSADISRNNDTESQIFRNNMRYRNGLDQNRMTPHVNKVSIIIDTTY